jgi:hypothetical protein
MIQLTGAAVKSSEQHEEIEISRTKQDSHDCRVVCEWLTLRNPFLIPDNNLHPLSSGVVSIREKYDVNCEKAEDVGEIIQDFLDNTSYINASIRRKDHVKTLISLQHNHTEAFKAGEVIIDSNAMFNRFVTVATRENKLEHFFDFELTHERRSLSKNGMMRKSDKPSLRKCIKMTSKIARRIFWTEGGALLHRLRWSKRMQFFEKGETYTYKLHKETLSITYNGSI